MVNQSSFWRRMFFGNKFSRRSAHKWKSNRLRWQAGQCVPVTQYPDGAYVQPGAPNQCTDGPTHCYTDFTISISPVSSTINNGGTSVYAVTFNFNNNKPYRFANIYASATGLNTGNFYWSGSGAGWMHNGNLVNNPSAAVLDMYNNNTVTIDTSRTLFLTVSGAPGPLPGFSSSNYTINVRAETGDSSGVNPDGSQNFTGCFGNCNPSKNAGLTVQPKSCGAAITSAPSDLQCGNISSTGYQLTWDPAGGTFDDYYTRTSTSYNAVADGSCASSDPTNCTSLPNTQTNFTTTNLQPDTVYYNRVAAVCDNGGGNIEYRDTGIISCRTNPDISSCVPNPIITNVSPDVLPGASGDITVDWGTIAGVSSYTIELRNSAGTLLDTNIENDGDTTFNVSPAAGGSTYKITVYSNVTSPAVACGGASEYVKTVYRPATSCPGTQGQITLNKYSAVYGVDFDVKAYSPNGYNCSDFNSSSPSVADVMDPPVGNPSRADIIVKDVPSGSTVISASGCVYQGGPVCPVLNSAQLSVTNIPPGGSYDFSLNPITFNFTAKINPTNGTLMNIAPSSGDMSVTNSVGSPGSLTIDQPWRYGEGLPPVFSDDSQLGIGYVGLSPGSSWNAGGNIHIQNNPAVQFPGTYSETMTYAGYDPISSVKRTSNKSITINLTVSPADPTDISYTVSPANLTFPTSGVTTRGGSLPGSLPITVTNTGTTNLTIGVSESIPWADFSIVGGGANPFTLTPSSVKTIDVTMTDNDPSPVQSSYTGTINFTQPSAGNKTVGITHNFDGGGGSCTPVIDGGWSEWSECSDGTRARSCTNPTPSCGNSCVGASVESCTDTPGTVTIERSSCGTVTSDPGSINCGATCQQVFPQGSTVELLATPKSQCDFVGWSGNCTGTNNPCVLEVTGSKTVTPIFILKPFFYQEF